jgi:hypothetical protein
MAPKLLDAPPNDATERPPKRTCDPAHIGMLMFVPLSVG